MLLLILGNIFENIGATGHFFVHMVVNQQKAYCTTWEISNTKCVVLKKRVKMTKKFAKDMKEIKKLLNFMSDELSKMVKKQDLLSLIDEVRQLKLLRLHARQEY